MSGENIYLITTDGKHLPLADYGVEVNDIGAIPVEYETSRGYGQHGISVHDWRLNERVISLSFGSGARNRTNYWTLRNRIIDALRPNRGGALTLRFVKPDGGRRDIVGWLQSGLGLTESVDGLNLDAAFSLLCPDPSFYDPATNTTALTSGDSGGFSFPLSFPMYFISGAALAATITNAGTWRAYPVITITGPYTGCTLRNTTTGGHVTLNVAIGSGAARIIDLTPGAQSVVDGSGNDKITELSSGNLLDWYLAPGANTISATLSGYDGSTAISVAYKTRYIAL